MSSFIINQEMFQTYSAVYSINTRNTYPHHSQIVRVSCFQKSTYHAGVSIHQFTMQFHTRAMKRFSLSTYFFILFRNV